MTTSVSRALRALPKNDRSQMSRYLEHCVIGLAAIAGTACTISKTHVSSLDLIHSPYIWADGLAKEGHGVVYR